MFSSGERSPVTFNLSFKASTHSAHTHRSNKACVLLTVFGFNCEICFFWLCSVTFKLMILVLCLNNTSNILPIGPVSHLCLEVHIWIPERYKHTSQPNQFRCCEEKKFVEIKVRSSTVKNHKIFNLFQCKTRTQTSVAHANLHFVYVCFPVRSWEGCSVWRRASLSPPQQTCQVWTRSDVQLIDICE